MTVKELDIELEPGLRYTEETGRLSRSLPVRDCFLWKEGIEDPISGLNLVSFEQRFGALSLPCEGIGGVETRPPYRRQGFMSKLVDQALKGITQRVKAVFVSDAVDGVYHKFGFVTCLAEGRISLSVRSVEQMIGSTITADNGRVRQFSAEDLPAMVDLYNQQHKNRTGTHHRHEQWNRLIAAQTWRPGAEILVCERAGAVSGYAIFQGWHFGAPPDKLVVDELTSGDRLSAQALLIELAHRSWKLRIGDFEVHEPLDSIAGRVAQEIGCRNERSFPANAGMMGQVMDRPGLLRALEPELKRRLPAGTLAEAHTRAFAALRSSDLIPDDQTLLRLLMGYWSLSQALFAGTEVPELYNLVCHAWFPGGNTPVLAQPYAHRLDRY